MCGIAERGQAMTRPLGVILAGGLARRMGGGDKALLPLGDGCILDAVLHRLTPQVAAMALNANGDPARFARFNLPVLADSIPGFAGPLVGVLAGLDWAAEQEAGTIVTVAADTPFFPGDLVDGLLQAAQSDRTTIALAATEGGKGGGWQPTFGLWPVALRDDLRTAIEGGTRKVLDWTDRHGAARAVFPVGAADPFFNVNTPEDLAMAERMLGAAG
jgi:molybdopterin-guanine dinucleotide biosynthesis protein A